MPFFGVDAHVFSNVAYTHVALCFITQILQKTKAVFKLQ